MRLHRFFIPDLLEHTREIVKDERLVHQWRNVFRYNVGSEVILFDGTGNEYDSVIEKLNNREAEVRLVAERRGIVPQRRVSLCQSLLKKDKMEWVVEKATELGVSKIVPIVSDRSEKKGINLERLKKIAVEASEQCGRADVPRISEVLSLNKALDNCENAIVCDPSATPRPLLDEGREGAISILIGPEGGWTPKEIERFRDSKIGIFSLGNLTLRAETAAIAALATLRLPD